MHIEVFERPIVADAKTAWYWHFRAGNGLIVADAQRFDTRAQAARAAKACVKAIFKPVVNLGRSYSPLFSKIKYHAPSKTYRITWE